MCFLDSTVGEVAIYDGHDEGDEEEARVYLPEEIVEDEEEISEEFVANHDREGRWVANNRAQRGRLCLPGCDCERTRGRKCGCELRGSGLCGADCQCDPGKCRTKRVVADDNDEED